MKIADQKASNTPTIVVTIPAARKFGISVIAPSEPLFQIVQLFPLPTAFMMKPFVAWFPWIASKHP